MKSGRIAIVVGVAALMGCAARGAQPGMDPTRWHGDPRLYALLNAYPIGQAQRDSITAYEAYHLSQTDELLAEAAEDVYAPIHVRLNALLLLSERGAGMQLPVFRAALDDDDARVRAMAASSLRRFMDTHPHDAERLARTALEDPAPEVQAQALHVLGDRDPALLRSYIPRAADPELRHIAVDLVRVAEARGVRLTGDAATGTLHRETPEGFTLTFTPATRWPQWDAAVGDVVVTRGGTTVATLSGIEAVAGVLPVFLSPEGTHVVYERDRRIIVRAVDTGAERVAGAGMAPRILPFTNDFVFVREAENGRTDMRREVRIRYDLLRAPFEAAAGAEPQVIGELTAVTKYDTHGNYSPVRWMHVEDRSGYFYLAAEGLEAAVPLPDPFRG
jgi:hypothetical protein